MTRKETLELAQDVWDCPQNHDDIHENMECPTCGIKPCEMGDITDEAERLQREEQDPNAWDDREQSILKRRLLEIEDRLVAIAKGRRMHYRRDEDSIVVVTPDRLRGLRVGTRVLYSDPLRDGKALLDEWEHVHHLLSGGDDEG